MDQANLTPTDEASAATTKHHHRHHHGAPADTAHVPAPLRASLDGASASVREKLRKREDRRGGWIKRQHPNMRLGADPNLGRNTAIPSAAIMCGPARAPAPAPPPLPRLRPQQLGLCPVQH